MKNILCWLWLVNLKGISSKKINYLLDKLGDVEEIYACTDFELIEGMPEADKKVLMNKSLVDAKRIYTECYSLEIEIVTWDNEDYPPLLRNISEPPYLLYMRGIIPDWDSIFTIGIVGTRRMTVYGQRVTSKLASELISMDVTLITGFAIGIDGEATRAAVNKNRFSIAVVGCGLDRIYPADHRDLYYSLPKCGLFISEYPPHTQPLPQNFPVRNRIIAGLSMGILVTEAPKRSGALITAHLAAEEGREVFAVPGDVLSYNYVGTNQLIQEGAKLVISGKDILDEFPDLIYRDQIEDNGLLKIAEPNLSEMELEGVQKQIAQALKKGDLCVDELVSILNVPASKCNSECFMLELSGVIQKLPGNFYHLNIR